MSTRTPLSSAKFADVINAMMGLNAAVAKSTLESALLYLVKVRASQINGCGHCIDMHTKDARLDGETEQRLYLVGVWREAPLYSARERAALAWTEVVTRLDQHGVPDSVYEEVRQQFSEDELIRLTLAVVAINGWNRLAISFAVTPGSYVAGSLKKA